MIVTIIEVDAIENKVSDFVAEFDTENKTYSTRWTKSQTEHPREKLVPTEEQLKIFTQCWGGGFYAAKNKIFFNPELMTYDKGSKTLSRIAW